MFEYESETKKEAFFMMRYSTRNKLIGLGIAVAILLIIAIWAISTYNGLVEKSETVKNYMSQIDNQLQRRNDLIPNLVNTVKNYAAQELEVYTNISNARAKLAGASTVSEKAEADAEISGALARLLVISESYPQLKSNANFIQLQDELAGTENRIANARRDYNKVAQEFNTSIRRFPTSIFARIFGFEQVDYFEASSSAKETPNVGDIFGK